MKSQERVRPVVVTTAHRGVFYGYPINYTPGAATIILRDCRNCLYWSKETRGVIGLAATGPATGSRVGPPADAELRDITAVFIATPEAAEQWETVKWME